MKRKIITALAVLGIMAGVFTAAEPGAYADIVRDDSRTCGSVPNEFVVYLEVIRHADNTRWVATRGYGVGYGGYSFPVYGPSEWAGEYLVERRTGTMSTGNIYYGVNTAASLPHTYTGRVFNSSYNRYCDVAVIN